jgi:hypothetical protein
MATARNQQGRNQRIMGEREEVPVAVHVNGKVGRRARFDGGKRLAWERPRF